MQEKPTTKVIPEIRCDTTIFIEEARLGVLESAVKAALAGSTKRKRQIDFNGLAQSMKILGLIPKGLKVVSMSLGMLDFGERGLFISGNFPVVVVPGPIEENQS